SAQCTRWMRARSAARGLSSPSTMAAIASGPKCPISIAPTLGSDVVQFTLFFHEPSLHLRTSAVDAGAHRPQLHAKSDGDFVVAHVQPIPKHQRNTVFRLQVGQRCV